MCLFLITVFFGPRAAILLWWLIEPGRWDSAFDTFVLPALGFLVVPWTTLLFVAVAPTGSVEGQDWGWLGLGVLLDLLFGGFLGFGRRRTIVYR